MFAYIEGALANKEVSSVIIDVQGVGYELVVSINSFERLPEVGERVRLLTHFLVREDAQTLFGFLEVEERSLFRLIMKVSGFGAKVSMSVLSSMSPAEFVGLIDAGDTAALTRLPGIGAKSADRLIVELKDKIAGFGTMDGEASLPRSSKNNRDAETALTGLGYKINDVRKVLSHIDSTQDIASMIRQALQMLSKK